MLEKEIKTHYLEIHDMRSDAYYGKKYTVGVTGEEEAQFIIDHGKIWTDMEAELIAEGYIKIPQPVMDYKAEILKLKDEVEKLKAK